MFNIFFISILQKLIRHFSYSQLTKYYRFYLSLLLLLIYLNIYFFLLYILLFFFYLEKYRIDFSLIKYCTSIFIHYFSFFFTAFRYYSCSYLFSSDPNDKKIVFIFNFSTKPSHQIKNEVLSIRFANYVNFRKQWCIFEQIQ